MPPHARPFQAADRGATVQKVMVRSPACRRRLAAASSSRAAAIAVEVGVIDAATSAALSPLACCQFVIFPAPGPALLWARIVPDACAAPALEFGGRKVNARDVKAPFVGAPGQFYETVTPAD